MAVRKKKDKTKGTQPHGLGKREEHFLHVKEFSQGKPNELSLNVLEQKAAAQDEPTRGFWSRFARSRREDTKQAPASADLKSEKSKAKEEVPKTKTKEEAPKTKAKNEAPKATSSAASSKKKEPEEAVPFLGVDSRAEIARRQRRRRLYRRLSIAIVVIVSIGLLSAGGYWAYQEHVRLSTSVGVLKEACSLIEQSDEVITQVDSYLQTEYNDETVETAQNLLSQFEGAREKLESARLYALQARDELEGSQTDQEAADRAINTVVARETILDAAEEILTQDIEAKPAIDTMDAAWTAIQEGNALMAYAAEVVSHTTENNVATSTEYTGNAQTKFNEARELILQAQEQYSGMDFTDEVAYVDKRLEAAEEALASNAAILLQDRATAEAHNDAYNAADAEAAEMAANFSDNFSQPIIDAYAAAVAEASSTYESARNDAAVNDSYLRDYLGSSTN